MPRLVHRIASVVVALVLVTALPLAAARAACVCDHEHQHAAAGHPEGEAAPHECTPACTAATCPMHRAPSAAKPTGAGTADTGNGSVRCDCAGAARALLTQVSIAGILPGLVSIAAPPVAPVPLAMIAEAPARLAAPPPAPPPRA